MALDHEAIRKAYPNATTIDDGAGAFDASGNSISLDASKVTEARTTLNAEAASIKYQTDRTTNGSKTYDTIGNQLDMLFKAIDADSDLKTKFATWHTHIKAVKDANPKP